MFRSLTKHIAILLFTWTASLLLAQHTIQAVSNSAALSRNTFIAGPALVQDLQIMHDTYTAMHPGLLRYNTPQQIDAAFHEASQHLEQGATMADIYLTLARLTAQVRCGHTYPNFFNQSEPVVQALFSGQNRLPFFFRWIGGGTPEMIVTRDLTPDHMLPRGTRIETINGASASSTLQRLMPYVRADGSNDSKRVALLGVEGEARWEAFDIYYPLLYGSSTRYELAVRTPEGKHSFIRADALTPKQRESFRATNTSRAGKAAFTFSRPAEGVLTLTMPTWALYNSKWDWRAFLDTAFDEAAEKNAKAMILDLRGNEGGDDEIGRVLLSHIIAEPTRISVASRLVRFQNASPELWPYLDTWDKTFLHVGAGAVPFTGSLPNLPVELWYALPDETDSKRDAASGTETLLPRGKRFAGKVIVLTDAQNSSATFQFADAIRKNKLGLLLGEPTGGNQRGINGGKFFFLRLPGSGLEVDLPLVGYFPSEKAPDAGLQPDVLVKTKPRDIAAGNDPQIRTALTFATKR